MSPEGYGGRGRPMPPPRSLPLDPLWQDEESYIQSLLTFATSSELFVNLCGGVHILDFMTTEPELYVTVLPQEWRNWFDQVDLYCVLEFLLHEDLEDLLSGRVRYAANSPLPPQSLRNYVIAVRRHSLVRAHAPVSSGLGPQPLSRRLTVGMKPKKIHEVQNFAAYVDQLVTFVADETGEPLSGLVDLGSGQNYLGRVLASPPYNHDVLAIERSRHNVTGARGMDVYAELARKEKIMRNKKEYRRQLLATESHSKNALATMSCGPVHVGLDGDGRYDERDQVETKGSITYIQHEIEDGFIGDIVNPPASTTDLLSASSTPSDIDPNLHEAYPSTQPVSKRSNLMAISLHSCGNLSHHGLRTLTPSLNPSVSAVALVGCCYNLLTPRLGPGTGERSLRLRHRRARSKSTSPAVDPHGFPMSKRLEEFPNPDGSTGIRLGTTARMMGVQAPYNWSRDDSEAFFTRHFYRALLQKILMDLGVVSPLPPHQDFQRQADPNDSIGSGLGLGTTPLVLGPLRKSAFASFPTYVHAALEKLALNDEVGELIKSKSSTLTSESIRSYEVRFASKRKQLAIAWTLMAFSAGVVESLIVVDRWLWLKEQVGWVGRCWVEPVFDYFLSPRNLVVVGIRERKTQKSTEMPG